jgi:hypothetical protein
MDSALSGVNSMATATAKKPTKTAFVTGFLKKHPQANPTAVNEAWAKAGHTGSVSPALVGRLRTDLGLSGNIRRTPGTAKKATKTRRRDEGKSSFIKELLVEHPQANADAVNKAWKKAGMEGTISVALVTMIRSELVSPDTISARNSDGRYAGSESPRLTGVLLPCVVESPIA